MTAARIGVELAMTARRLARNRLALVLLLLLPATFFGVIWAVTPARSSWVELATVPAEVLSPLGGPAGPDSGHGAPVRAPQRSVGLVFVALAAVGILAAFLGRKAGLYIYNRLP